MAKKRSTARVTQALKYYVLNEEQEDAVQTIIDNKIVILTGAAGVAKSFTSVYAAMKLLNKFDTSRVALTRPMVTTEKMGFLPGTAQEKFSPYLEPLVAFFNAFGEVGEKSFDSLLVGGLVRMIPVAFMRGQTISNEILIFDEAQQSTPEQMLMVLTRLGQNGKIVINGDRRQSDTGLKVTGLDYAIKLAEKIPEIKHIHLTQNMRDELITRIMDEWSTIAF